MVIDSNPESGIITLSQDTDTTSSRSSEKVGAGWHSESAPSRPSDTNKLGAGASPCNTAPANCISDENSPIKVLGQGVDSLYLTYSGRTDYFVNQDLLALKDLAKSTDPSEQALAVFKYKEHQFEVKPAGSGLFPLVLTNNAYYIKLSSIKAQQLPLAQIQIRSHWLFKLGIEGALEELTPIISHFGEVEGEAQVSRADLYVDFMSDADMTDIDVIQWVSRALNISEHSISRECSGYSIGLGGDISGRLYDKTREIEKSKKNYMKASWHRNGWEPNKKVWRLEFQLMRPALSKHGTNTVHDLLNKLGSLWRYCTLNWLRLSIPNPKDKTQSRWPLHPVWEAIANIPWYGLVSDPSLPVRACNPPSEHYMFVHGFSGYSSYLAANDELHSDEVFNQYYQKAKEYHNLNSFHTGQDFERYVNEKAALKAKKHNLPFPEIDKKRDEHLVERRKDEAANVYKKGKDGE